MVSVNSCNLVFGSEECAGGKDGLPLAMPNQQGAHVCCPGLKSMGPYGWIFGQCVTLLGPSLGCSATCGDGVCEYNFNENICNCPQDCKKAKKECAGENEFIANIIQQQRVVPMSWYPDKCCKGLKPVDYGNGSFQCVKV